MGTQSNINPRRLVCCLAAVLLLLFRVGACQTTTQATTIPLIMPSGLAYDTAGNLLFAQTGRQQINRVSPAGVYSTLAGSGTQGFAGDGGPAIAAQLDTPTALTVDAAGNIFFADSHNHRVRRIDAGTGVITSVATVQSPGALAIDPAGSLLIGDAYTHRIFRVGPSGVLAALAGSGVQGFSGDGGAALAASLDTPSGLAVDSAGNIYVVDSHTHTLRRIDAATGIISTVANVPLPLGLGVLPTGSLLLSDASTQRLLQVSTAGVTAPLAGNTVQAFAGDGGPALAASLDSPGPVTVSPAGLVTFSDVANNRIRQVDSSGIIHTIAGIGAVSSATLTLAAPSVLPYGGAANVTATLIASAAGGTVTFFDVESAAAPVTLLTAPLTANVATLPGSQLQAGAYWLLATYTGDTLHPAAQSTVLSVTVAQAALLATPVPVSVVYGQPIPALTGTLSGVLPQDTAAVTASFTSAASPTSAPGVYPVTASILGKAAGNYTVTQTAAAVTISQSPVLVTLSQTLAGAVASSTTGTPTGTLVLLDGTTSFASQPLSNGATAFSAAGLTLGTHTLTASYAGDRNFLPGTSAPTLFTVGPVTAPDFSLAVNGSASATIPAGSSAQYSFAITPLNGGLSSPILLSASGLPTGATASFSPAQIPPGNTPAASILTISTPRAALARPVPPFAWALLLPVVLLCARRRRMAALLALSLTLGCGDRINHGADSVAMRSYTITVAATGTQTTGATVLHTVTLTLNIQQ